MGTEELCPQGHDKRVVGVVNYHCRECHRASVREAQRRYEGTAKGMLAHLRYDAKRRGVARG
jgi:hypothetical protein